jgi:hypothetical protein
LRAAAVDGHGLRPALHQITGDRDHALEHGLDAARVRPQSEITSCARKRRPDVPLRPRPGLGIRDATTIRRSPRACEETHVQAKRIGSDESNVARMQGDDSPGCSPAAHERHRMCSARAGEPRSTPERACFTTRPDATLTCRT